MDFAWTAAQEAFVGQARRFATDHLVATAQAREDAHAIDAAIVRDMASLGLLGVNVPKSLGGAQAGVVAYASCIREIARADAAVAVTMAVSNMVAEAIVRFGSEAQRAKHVPALVEGRYFAGAFALSEAAAGSDPRAMLTRAVPHADGFKINGQKAWITSGDQAGVMVVWAQTDFPGGPGMSCFLVEQGTPGVSFGKPEEKMGLRASHTVAVFLQDVCVPASQVLGELGGGFKIALSALDGGRIGIASQALGMGYAALDIARAHVGRRANVDQGAMFALADMATQCEAAWCLTLRAAACKEMGGRFTRQAAMAKVFASEAANQVVSQAVALVGHSTDAEALRLNRLFRDVRVTKIYEGTSEIQRLVIAREVLSAVA